MEFARVRHEIALIARAPVCHVDGGRTADIVADETQDLVQANGIVGPATQVEGLPAQLVDVAPHGKIGIDRVPHVEDVANLAAIAIKHDSPPFDRTDQEMGDPALVLRPHLPLPIDATHAQYGGGHAEAAAIIEDILVSRPFRTAIGSVEIERAALVYAMFAQRPFGGMIGVALQLELDILQAAVHFVRRREDHRRWRDAAPRGFQHVESAQHIDFKVSARVGEAGGDGDLCRHVEHSLGLR